MRGSSLVLAVLAASTMATTLAAPQYDPARADGPQGPDPADVSVRPAASGSRTQPPSLMGQTSQGLPMVSSDDYRQAYGNSEIQDRLGRTFSADDTSQLNLLSQWLQQPTTNGASALQTSPAQDLANDHLSNQLLPLLQELKQDLDSGLQRSHSVMGQ